MSVSAIDRAGHLEGIEIGGRAVGELPLRAQHLLQPVGALAAEDLHGLIDRLVVVVLARNREVADPDLGLHRVLLVDDDHALGRVGRLGRAGDRHRARLPAAEIFLEARHRLGGLDVADHGEQRVVGDEVAAVEVDEVGARQRGQRFGRAVAGQAVRMEAVDQAIDHLAGHRVRILGRHLERRQRLLPLPVDFLLANVGRCTTSAISSSASS